MSRWRPSFVLPEDLAPTPHGGPDAAGAARFDFSTNANAAGPLPSVAAAVAAADRTRYPDPDYAALRARLAALHGVDAARIVVAGSASEFIQRLSVAAARAGRVQRAIVPRPGYGEYAAAARAAGLELATHGSAERPRVPTADDLWWLTEPASPDGGTRIDHGLAARLLQLEEAGALVALDLAYAPLRLDGRTLPPEAELAWQLWSPNKGCGLPGVRGAYAIAPRGEEAAAQLLRAVAPSWVCGAEGVAMLAAFAAEPAQAELAEQRVLLTRWRALLADALRGAGWETAEAASVTPFFVARPPAGAPQRIDWRRHDIALRDCASLGRPGWWRLSAQPPAAVDALVAVLQAQPEPAR